MTKIDYEKLIKESGYKKQFIAQKLGISRQYLYYFLSGKKRFPSERVEDLHRLLGIENEVRNSNQ